jgi:hypothetical protein
MTDTYDDEARTLILGLEPLLTAGRLAEAARRVASVRDRMIDENNLRGAARLTSFLATIATAEDFGVTHVGFSSEEESARAEQLSDDPSYKLANAHRLMMKGELDGAEQKLKEIDENSLSAYSRPSAIELRGQIAARRGEVALACQALQKLLNVSRAQNRHPIQWTLHLVEDLIRRQMCRELCIEYVNTVVDELRKAPAPPVEETCTKLLQMLNEHP